VVALVGERQGPWSDCSKLREKVGICVSSFRYLASCFFAVDMARRSLLFHHALQRMLVLRAKSITCVTWFRHLVGVDPAFPDAVIVDMEHDAVAVSWSLLKKRSST